MPNQTKEGDTVYLHIAITPVVVAPDNPHVLPYVPEFVVPQDGTEKQDCELNAAKRCWVQREQKTLRQHQAILLGDDLYSRQPLCAMVIDSGLDLIFVAHPQSHSALYAIVDAAIGLNQLPRDFTLVLSC